MYVEVHVGMNWKYVDELPEYMYVAVGSRRVTSRWQTSTRIDGKKIGTEAQRIPKRAPASDSSEQGMPKRTCK